MPLPAFLAALGPALGAIGEGAGALGKFGAANPNLTKGLLGGLTGGIAGATEDPQIKQMLLAKLAGMNQGQGNQQSPFGQLFRTPGINPGANL